MELVEVLRVLHELPRADKVRAVQYLAADLAQEERGLDAGGQYAIWSPHDAVEAAATLTRFLREQPPMP